MNDRSDDPSHLERTLSPQSYISLPAGAKTRTQYVTDVWPITWPVLYNKPLQVFVVVFRLCVCFVSVKSVFILLSFFLMFLFCK